MTKGARDVPYAVFANPIKTFITQFVDAEKAKKPRERKVSSSSASSKNDSIASDASEKAAESSSSSASSSSKVNMDYIQQFFASKLRLFREGDGTPKEHQVLKTIDLDGIVEHWKNNGCKKIVTMAGAGISTCESH